MTIQSDASGKLSALSFDKKAGDATALSFKIISKDGQNNSLPAAAQLLPWKKLNEIAALTGEEISFEHMSLYEIVNADTGRILMRSAPASDMEGDNKIEVLYVPHQQPVSPEAEMATFRQMALKMYELGIIEYADMMVFNSSVKRELGFGSGASMAK